MKHYHVKRDKPRKPSTWAAIPIHYPEPPKKGSLEETAAALISFLEANNRKLEQERRRDTSNPSQS